MEEPTLIVSIPYPPSVNRVWRCVRSRVMMSREGREYRAAVAAHVRSGSLRGRLAVEILALPPDRRRRDLDNALKAALDALTHAGVWEDDSQIDELTIIRGDAVGRDYARLEVSIRQRQQ